VDDDPTKQGMTVKDLKVFGFTRRIPEIVKQQDVGLILFAIEAIQPKDQARILKLCRQTSARVVMIPDLMTTFRERLSVAAPVFSDRNEMFDLDQLANRVQKMGEDRRRNEDRRKNADRRRNADGARNEEGRRTGDRDGGQS
jgi:FlaA1/EpsC-like NDP-sugar epimerase